MANDAFVPRIVHDMYDCIHRSDVAGLRRCIVGGADVNHTDQYGSVLHQAVYWSNIECVRLLLEAGANIHAKNVDGCAPLHLTSSIEMAELLLRNGAEIDVRNNAGESTLKRYIDNTMFVEFLIAKGADVNIVNNRLWTPLNCASYCGYEQVIKLLLKANANVNMVNKYGNTPLHYACRNGNVTCVKLLLQAGAKVNIQNNKGKTPLHSAVMVPIMELLLQHKANINASNNDNKTVLHIIIENGNFEGSMDSIQWLLDHGATIDSKDKHSWTPLHYASDRGSVEHVKLLLDRGADANAKTNSDQTAQFLAHRHLNRQVLDELGAEEIDAYTKIETLLFEYAFKNVKSARRV